MHSVLTTGCFDLLHVGHVRLLEYAACFGPLTVGINSDASTARLKPGRPIFREVERIAMLRALRCVSHVAVFEEDTPYALIDKLAPDLYLRGPGSVVDVSASAWLGVLHARKDIVILDWDVEVSTTLLIERIAKCFYESRTLVSPPLKVLH